MFRFRYRWLSLLLALVLGLSPLPGMLAAAPAGSPMGPMRAAAPSEVPDVAGYQATGDPCRDCERATPDCCGSDPCQGSSCGTVPALPQSAGASVPQDLPVTAPPRSPPQRRERRPDPLYRPPRA